MDDEAARKRIIIDRANRMLKQSRSLREMSTALSKEAEDLMKESNDLRRSVRPTVKRRTAKKR